ncbi:hypothetical protein [Methylobacterium iners]|uniref:Uncharacterized protein n=1 Tax=Methylobacterium iners TaxID=418707 RepID=A0ABQ4RU21_9HYPH|nr:hypothetical protein [Methylobacterium iners]GJD93673.1 hypothetical protein OCOJLMKI_0869 [Methylobacterium iners]
MTPYSIQALTYSNARIVWFRGVKAAILFPPLYAGGPYELYPHPETYPGLSFEGLPSPLRPEFMPFATLDDVYAFLGIRPKAMAA